MRFSEKISEALKIAAIRLPEDVLLCIRKAKEEEQRHPEDIHSRTSLSVLDAILENLELSSSTSLPMCQDTGMFDVFVDLGRDCPLTPKQVERSINEGCLKAVQEAFYRCSVVEDPIFSRKNTQNNLPAIIWWSLVEGSSVSIKVLLKGFGSENCSSVRMLNPTGGEQAVVEAVAEIVRLAGGKPCPPIFVGVGLGGTMERAAYLSKRALLRDASLEHSESLYAQLEKSILDRVQALGIGSGGFGGRVTALHVAVEKEPTHIAGMPLAVSINCWADRKVEIVWEGEDV